MSAVQHAEAVAIALASPAQWQRLDAAIAALLAVSPRSDLPAKMENRRAYGVLQSERHLKWAIDEIEQATKNASEGRANAAV